ncbi:MAG TPA: exosortase B [Rhodocyclaceae bacterium]|nr:exosortase B [Rhodocyclaceae bacterium]
MDLAQRLSPRFHFQAWAGLPVLLICWTVLFLPTYYDLWHGLWRSSDQGQGPIVLAIAVCLMLRKLLSPELAPPSSCGAGIGAALFGLGLALYVLGRSQEILLFEVGAQVPVLAGLVLLLYGVQVLRQLWFPLLFLIFMVPLPGAVVDALTMPMKILVSWTVENLLHLLDYPVARSGVMLQVGQYKLLVADACAGLHTLFMLESLGLLYLHLVRRESWFRNIALATLIVPIALLANVIRVASLALMTYYFGDEVGQGFMHEFAGLVLFASAFLIILCTDGLLTLVGRLLPMRAGAAHA